MASWACPLHGADRHGNGFAADFLSRMSPAEAGERIFRSRGCRQCHSVDGDAGIGPTFKGLYGKTGVFDDGTSYTAEENYIRKSILEQIAQEPTVELAYPTTRAYLHGPVHVTYETPPPGQEP